MMENEILNFVKKYNKYIVELDNSEDNDEYIYSGKDVLAKICSTYTSIDNMYDKLGVYFAVPPLVKHNNELASMRRLNSGKSATTRWFSEVQDKIEIV